MFDEQLSLWDFSCDLYGKQGVESALLSLQNDHGLIINHLLFAAWLANRGLFIHWSELLIKEKRIGLLERVVIPVRQFRFEMKDWLRAHNQVGGVAGALETRLYQQVKQLELGAEKKHLQFLQSLIVKRELLEDVAVSERRGANMSMTTRLEWLLSDYRDALASSGEVLSGFSLSETSFSTSLRSDMNTLISVMLA